MIIYYRWPGSVHDSTIFDNSLVRAKFENHEYWNNVFLIGDGGYPCRNYLMTPLLNTSTQAEENYQVNKHLKPPSLLNPLPLSLVVI